MKLENILVFQSDFSLVKLADFGAGETIFPLDLFLIVNQKFSKISKVAMISSWCITFFLLNTNIFFFNLYNFRRKKKWDIKKNGIVKKIDRPNYLNSFF